MRNYILVQKADDKVAGWSAANTSSTQIVSVPGSAVWTPLELARNMIKRRARPRAVVIRYLNDYPSLLRTVVRAVSECLTIAACLCLRIRIVWLCHNVDRESSENYPMVSRYRRKVHGKFASKILVTDPLLVRHAKLNVPYSEGKLGWLTFGDPRVVEMRSTHHTEVFKRVESFVESVRRPEGAGDGKRVIIGVTVGSPSKKKLETYRRIPSLIAAAGHYGYSLRMIVLGPVREMIKEEDARLLRELESNPAILFIGDRYVEIDNEALGSLVDFYWRVYTDLSVPYSVYHAASVGRPTVTMRVGFLYEMIQEYGLGVVIDDDFNNLKCGFDRVLAWPLHGTNHFTRTHNWKTGSEALVEHSLSAQGS